MTPSSTIALLLGLLCLRLSALAARQSPPALAVVHVPLTASSDNQRYFANINMSFGAKTQRFGFALSTTTGYTTVAAASCANCTINNIPTYNSTLSNSAKIIDSGNQQRTVHIAGGTYDAGTGVASKEDCALRQFNGSFWEYSNQTIIQTNFSSVFQTGVSGLIGLGTNTANFGDTVFAEWLYNNPTESNFTFGLALNPLSGAQAQASISSSGSEPSNPTGNAGTLHLEQSDPSSYTGEIRWQEVQNIVPSSNGATNSSGVNIGNLEGSSWLIQMDGWSSTSGSAQTNNSQAALAAVEPYFPKTPSNAHPIYYSSDASLVGAAPLPVIPSDIGQVYSIPCDADITFTVKLSGYDYFLPKETLVIKTANGSCIGAIEGWTNPTATNYLLGSRFISTVYIAFQIGQLPAAQQQVGIAQRVPSPTKKSVTGIIEGSVIGGVAFLIIAGGAALWGFQRGRRTLSTGTGYIQQSQPGRDKTTSEAPEKNINHSMTSPIMNSGTASGHYYPTNTPSTFHSPPASATYQTSFPVVNSPSGTGTSEAFLLSGPSLPSVKQWVTNLTPTSANHSPTSAIPVEYDYGNDGKPGTFISPSIPEGSEERGKVVLRPPAMKANTSA